MSKSSGSVVWASVAGAVVTVVATSIWGKLGAVWDWLAAGVSAAWRQLLGTSALPNWVVYLLVLMAIQSLMYWAFRWIGSRKDSISRYNQDGFLGARWKWSFTSGAVRGLWAYCQRCGTALVYSHDGGAYTMKPATVSLHCENCGSREVTSDGRREDLIGRVTRQIHRKVESGEWRAVVDAAEAK